MELFSGLVYQCENFKTGKIKKKSSNRCNVKADCVIGIRENETNEQMSPRGRNLNAFFMDAPQEITIG